MATINDLVLIYMEDSPLAFARVEDIQPDIKRDWFQIKLLVLQIPPALVTWILKDAYINGEEYTMGGKKMRLEKVVVPETTPPSGEKGSAGKESDDSAGSKTKDSKSKVISLADLKKSPR
ncbi:MAG: hypothetical protein R6U27_14670 [Desulfobacterales bacterium]